MRKSYWHRKWNRRIEFEFPLSLLSSHSQKSTLDRSESTASKPWIADNLGEGELRILKREKSNGKPLNYHSGEVIAIYR